MRTRRSLAAAGACLCVGAILVAGCGASTKSGDTGGSGAGLVHSATTAKPAAGTLTSVVWGDNRGEPPTLDWIDTSPLQGDMPLASVCESLLSIHPDGTTGAGLADKVEHPNPTTWVYDLRSGVRFHDGTPMTAADAVFSLRRAAFSKESTVAELAGNVKTITNTGPLQVTVTLKQPDALWNEGVAGRLGVVEEASYVKRLGSKYGTPQGLPMCTGPYALTKWTPGVGFTLTAAKDYWNAALRPHVQSVELRFYDNSAAMTTGLASGEVDGAFELSPDTLPQLMRVSGGTVTAGPDPEVMSIEPVSTSGPLADPRVRAALAYVIDRVGIAKAIYDGAATPVRSIFSPAMWGYAQSVFRAGYDKLPDLNPDLAKAKRLVQEAGSPARSIVITVPASLPEFVQAATTIQSAAQSVGLHLKINAVSNTVFGGLFSDPSLRKGTDAVITTAYIPLNEPLIQAFRMLVPDGPRNFNDYSNPKVTQLLEQARATDDPSKRAALIVQAQAIFMPQFPWIPIVSIDGTVFQGPRVTGAPASTVGYAASPWAAMIGPRR